MKHWKSKENRVTIAEVYKSSGRPHRWQLQATLCLSLKLSNYSGWCKLRLRFRHGRRGTGRWERRGLLQQVCELFERRYELRPRHNVVRLLYPETRKWLDKYENTLMKKIPCSFKRFLHGASLFLHLHLLYTHPEIVERI